MERCVTPLREPSHRAERVADLIRQELALALKRQVKDPRVGFVTVTRVKVTRDMRTARVAVSILATPSRSGDSPATAWKRRGDAPRP